MKETIKRQSGEDNRYSLSVQMMMNEVHLGPMVETHKREEEDSGYSDVTHRKSQTEVFCSLVTFREI